MQWMKVLDARPDRQRVATRCASEGCASYIGAMKSAMRQCDWFSGRASRMEYWSFNLTYGAIFSVAVLAAYAGESMRSVAWLFLAATVVMILPLLAVTVRRVHDTNVTGWAALAQFIPYIGLLVMFVHMSIPGTVGPNRYGDDPLASRRGDRALGQY